MIRTRFTEMFGLDHPVMSAPMAMHSGGTLAGAVCAAGALGSFGGISPSGASWIGEQAALVRARSSGPFAIGFITPFLPAMRELFDAALAARPAAIALSFSDPTAWAADVHRAGCRLICQVQTFVDADRAIDAGADVLVAQGNEAGGHTGTMALLPLLRGIAAAHPDVPLLAAGGIGDGATLAAALVAGADGAWLGTAMLATDEAVEIGEDYRRSIVESDGTDTVFTRAYDIASGLPWPPEIGARVQRDDFTEAWTDREAELRGIGAAAMPASTPRYFGQSARFVERVRPAGDVVRAISLDAERILRDRPIALR